MHGTTLNMVVQMRRLCSSIPNVRAWRHLCQCMSNILWQVCQAINKRLQAVVAR
jgi:hypothetical protein